MEEYSYSCIIDQIPQPLAPTESKIGPMLELYGG